MEMKNTDLSARLLATENISVVRANTRTASFDIKSRVLTLPLWKEMTPEIEDMLVGHEVGHALYTGEKYIEPIKENPKMQSYLNIIEDVRIEKLIKRKYPGLRKRMNEGYKQLNDRDFFEIKTLQSFDDLLLIDKINLYFKAGFTCGVKFSSEEKDFVNRAERTETVEEVIQLAKDVYAYSKQKMEERKEIQDEFELPNEENQEFEDNSASGGEDAAEDYDRIYSPADPFALPKNTEDLEETLESKTERAFSEKLQELADENTKYVYWKFNNNYFNDPVVSYRTVLNETVDPEHWTQEDIESFSYRYRNMDSQERSEAESKLLQEFQSFKNDSKRTVNYLVKEFEMKKSAQTYKRALTSKIGSLDMRKIFAYKLKDDLFKRVTVLPEGKNHGMLMLVDWSGSMDDVLKDVMQQVINLSMFCQNVQIPFRVLAFTSDYNTFREEGEYKRYYEWRGEQEAHFKATDERVLDNRNFNLLELFSSDMTRNEFNCMARRVLHYTFSWNKGYATGGTPLNEALVWVYQNIGSYIKKNNIEKMNFITLTDGAGHQLNGVAHSLISSDYENINGVHKRFNIKNLIRDDVTQKTYFLECRDASSQTETILRMIKDRYNVTIIGFHITEIRARSLHCAIRDNLPNYNGDVFSLVENWKKAFRKDGVAVVKNTGRDELYIVPTNSTKIQEGSLDVNADASAKVIAKNFTKYLNVKKTSRVLLNRFVSLVA
jgi:hypothetical protein